jgi:hypothetical protein
MNNILVILKFNFSEILLYASNNSNSKFEFMSQNYEVRLQVQEILT